LLCAEQGTYANSNNSKIFNFKFSRYALGAILAQHDDNNQEYFCHYASRFLKNAEIHYGISEKCNNCYAIRQFRIYLHGLHYTVVTDH
jgi:hypothetical protein